MISIKIFGSIPPCAKCRELENRAKKVAERYNGQIEVTKLDALSEEADRYGILLTPAMVINDVPVSAGKLLSEDDIDRAVKKILEGQVNG